jgi:8-oxo-dGTP pyrophosphatase MutT (NUDIX family)
MQSPSVTLRYAAKAIIIREGRILCLKKVGDIGTFFVLPGGGQNPGELLPDTVKRECREELGAAVEVGRLRYVQEYVGDNHDFRKVHKGRHFVNMYFEVRLLEPPETHALAPDDGQVGLEWLEVPRLAGMAFFPRALAARLVRGPAEAEDRDVKYLGDSV